LLAGHRVPVPDPGVAEATIDEFGVFDDRKEAEVVIDPAQLRGLVVHELPRLLARGPANGRQNWQEAIDE
jgi:hypothetical protein